MKSTGVVRRIDDLGRIVIPKEIRKTLKINEGDNVEIYVRDDNIVLKKYLIVDSITELIKKIISSFYKIYNKSILITDKEKVIGVTKNIEKEYYNLSLTANIKNLLDKRIDVSDNNNIVVNGNKENFYLFPIIANSDIIGSIILIDNEINESDKNIIKLISAFLVKNIEE